MSVENVQTVGLKPRQVRLIAITVSVILLALIWSGFFVTTRSINANFESSFISSLEAETLYIDDQLERAFEQVDATLTTASSIIKLLSSEGTPITNASFAPLIGNDRLIRSLSLLDSSGRVVASSNPQNVTSLVPINPLLKNVSPQNTTNAGVIYGEVQPHRSLHEWADGSESPTQRLLPAALILKLGQERYTLVAVINVALFNNFWERIGHSENTEIAVFNYDGLKFLSHHVQGIESKELYSAISQNAQLQRIGYFFLDDAKRFLVAYRASEQYPKITATIANFTEAKKPVAADIALLMGLAILGSVLIVAVILVTYRLYMRYERVATYSRNLLDGLTAHIMMSRSDTDGVILDVNAPFLEATGYQREDVIGQNYQIFYSGLQTKAFHEDLWQTIQDGKIWKGTFRNLTKQGNFIWLNSTIIPLKDEWGKTNQFVTMYSDISKAIKMTEEIESERVARHALEALNKKLQTDAARDALTGCWNRRGLDQFLDELSEEQGLWQGSVSVLMLDIDHFKEVNDSRGHHAGDEVLRQIVKVWLTCIRTSDLLVRLGGEEFAIILFRSRVDDAWNVAENLRLATEKLVIQIPDQDTPIAVTVSVGIAHAQQASKPTIEDLMRKADTALYKAKESGRNQIKIAQ